METENYMDRIKPSPQYHARKKRKAPRHIGTINLSKVKQLAAIGMPVESIARRMGISTAWFWEQKTKSFELEDALIAGQYEFEEGLRTVQARLALSGHPGMLIWLGKQFLGQSDKQESKSETTVNVVLQNAMKEAREMTQQDREELLAIFERQRKPLLIDQAAPDAIQEAP